MNGYDYQDYVTKINKKLKGNRVCHIVALIIFLINNVSTLSWVIINAISSKSEIVLSGGYVFIQVLLLFVIVNETFKYNSCFNEVRGVKGIIASHIGNFVMFWLLAFLFLIGIFFGQVGYLGIISYYCGATLLSMLIGHVFLVKACVTVKKHNSLAEKESKEENKKGILTQQALAKTGKIFFIKYYNQLKKYNFIDIFDAIKENYSEDDKKRRIENAKKIFAMDLQLVALNIVLRNEDGVANQEVLDVAKSILEKETAELFLM